MSIRKAVILGMTLLAALAFAAGPAQAATKVYNLYATDGYVPMADGTPVYIYGFVGGEQNTQIKYLKTTDKGVSTLSPAVTVPNPTGGAVLPAEGVLQGAAQFPAPAIYCAVGDVVEIRLKNLGVTKRSAPNDPHTIHLHGLDVDAANDGVPETSIAAVPANLPGPGAGNVVVYMFAAEKAGTYMYHCHQEASIHVQMGMYGALVVYDAADVADTDSALNNGGPGKGKGGTLYGWRYDKDYILLLSEFDIGQHVAEEFNGTRGAYNSVNFKPQYWFVNGLSFPNTVHAGLPGFNFNNWLAANPNYDPLIVGSVTGGQSQTGEKVLLRVINMGFQVQPMHMHGYHAKIIGSDQRAWPWANEAGITPFGEGLEKNTLTVGSGETYEWLIDMGQQALNSTYDKPARNATTASFLGGTQTRYAAAAGGGFTLNQPLSNTLTGNPAIPDPFVPPFTYIGGPIVGPVLVNGASTQNDVTEIQAILTDPLNGNPQANFNGQFFPFHNHDDYKATNNGVYPGGMFTMIVTTL